MVRLVRLVVLVVLVPLLLVLAFFKEFLRGGSRQKAEDGSRWTAELSRSGATSEWCLIRCSSMNICGS
jgi:hypothetical protein